MHIRPDELGHGASEERRHLFTQHTRRVPEQRPLAILGCVRCARRCAYGRGELRAAREHLAHSRLRRSEP